MRHDVHRMLGHLTAECGKEYGKLVQKLLAIACCESGAVRLIDRSTQGIDLEVTFHDGLRVAFEVKTGQAGTVTFGKKDLDGLAGRASGGFEPYFALLGARLVDDWIFARYLRGEVAPQKEYSMTALRAYRDRALEKRVSGAFAASVLKHVPAALSGGQSALDRVLEGYKAYVLA